MSLLRAGSRYRGLSCVALALLNLVLGYRSALADYLASTPMSHEGTLLGDPLQVETQDRKPKPTRQQLTSSSERVIG